MSSEKKPSYLAEMLKHRYSLYGFLGAVAGGAALSVVAAPLAVVPLIGFAAIEGVAALFIPSARWWQDSVDSKQRAEHRAKLVTHLMGEVSRRVPNLHHTSEWSTYMRMLERVDTLRRTAAQKLSKVTTRDVERLADAAVNYLSLWSLVLVLRERQDAFRAENVDRRIDELERQLADKEIQGADRLRFEKARDDLQRVLERRTTVDSHLATARTGMLTLADGLEEIFGNVMKNPQSDDVRAYLDNAIEQVRISDGVEAEMHTELGLDLDSAFRDLEQKEAAKATIPAKRAR